MPSDRGHSFVADGHERGVRSTDGEIGRLRREYIEKHFGDRYHRAGWFRKWLMDREVDDVVREQAGKTFPPDALYISDKEESSG